MYEQLFSKILDIYHVPLDEQEYIFSYYSLGLVAVIQKWIEKDCIDDVNKIANNYKSKAPKNPASDVANLLSNSSGGVILNPALTLKLKMN